MASGMPHTGDLDSEIQGIGITEERTWLHARHLRHSQATTHPRNPQGGGRDHTQPTPKTHRGEGGTIPLVGEGEGADLAHIYIYISETLQRGCRNHTLLCFFFAISGHFGDSNCTTVGHYFLGPNSGAVLFFDPRFCPHSLWPGRE